MELYYKAYLLEFKHPFGVSSNTRKETPVVFVKLVHEGLSGYGEACLPAYLGENVEQTISFFKKAKPLLKRTTLAFSLIKLLEEIDSLSLEHNAAKAALDIAVHDIAAKAQGKSFTAMMGFKKSEPLATSFTIGIDNEEMIIQKINEAEEFEVLKIKAGSADDKKLIELVRKYTNKPLYVDVNQGWKDKFFVLEMIHWMKEQGVILVEQPMPVCMREEMAWVTEQSVLPTIADESVKRLKDLENLKGCFSGVNIKLMKCTGLNEAMRMIDYCRNNNLKILLGCMAESSCATSAMAQLMQFADYIDLDAPNLYKNDPFKGITYKNGKVYLSDKVGIGAEPIESLLNL